MITLPEELLKCSEKELEKILTAKNIYTANYIVSGEFLFKRVHTYKNQLICINTTNQCTEVLSPSTHSMRSLKPYHFYELKSIKQSLYLNTCTDDQFVYYLKNLGKDIFGENRIDVQIKTDPEIDKQNFIDLIIHFPEITITNSHEISHTMYDIYVRFRFAVRNRIRVLYTIGIARTTFSIGELSRSYTFSHCSTDPGMYSNSCCFGYTILKELFENGKKGELLRNISTFLLSFEEYLKWESLEGTPYNYISQIKDISKYTSHNYHSYDFNQFYNYIISQTSIFKYQFDLVSGSYQIHLDSNSKEEIERLLTEKFPSKCYYLVNGKSCTLNTSMGNSYTNKSNQDTQVIFKGNKKKFKILEDKLVENPEKRIHRTILDNIFSMIETNFYNHIINKKLEETI